MNTIKRTKVETSSSWSHCKAVTDETVLTEKETNMELTVSKVLESIEEEVGTLYGELVYSNDISEEAHAALERLDRVVVSLRYLIG